MKVLPSNMATMSKLTVGVVRSLNSVSHTSAVCFSVLSNLISMLGDIVKAAIEIY
jgi:hypothetical protein